MSSVEIKPNYSFMSFPLSGLKHSSLQYTVGPRKCALIPRHSCTLLLYKTPAFSYFTWMSLPTVDINLQHLRTPGIHARAQFVDFSSALNTSLPNYSKLLQLPALCPVCKSTMAKQQVWLGSNLSVLLKDYPSSNGCIPSHTSIKLADKSTVLRLIEDNNEPTYRKTVAQLAAWCTEKTLELNVKNMLERVIDFS